MWSRGTKRRSASRARGTKKAVRSPLMGQYSYGQEPYAVTSSAGRPGGFTWRRFRQRLRAWWRWVVVRSMRDWMHRRSTPTPVYHAQIGDVREFPPSRWP